VLGDYYFSQEFQNIICCFNVACENRRHHREHRKQQQQRLSNSSNGTASSHRQAAKRRVGRLAPLRENEFPDTCLSGESSKENARRPIHSMEQAQLVAKAKLSANKASCSSKSSHRKQRQKHRHSVSNAKDDIFRSKQQSAQDAATAAENLRMAQSDGSIACRGRAQAAAQAATSPLSRFLCKHPAIINSLCFANPVTDTDNRGDNYNSECVAAGGWEDSQYSRNAYNKADSLSVISDTDTLNTAGNDTMTSTLYYEATKLAGLVQINPPMPLFNHFCVDGDDQIQNIVRSKSHSSVKMREFLNTQPVVDSLQGLKLGDHKEGASRPTSQHQHTYSPPAMVNVCS